MYFGMLASAVNQFHRIEGEVKLEIAHPFAMYTLKGLSRCHAEFGKQPRLRRPLFMLRAREVGVSWWGQGRRVLWPALGVAYFFFMGEFEQFTETPHDCTILLRATRGCSVFHAGK